MKLESKKVTIVGLGRSGSALIRLVSCLKGIARVSEQSSFDEIKPLLENLSLLEGLETEFGGHTQRFIEDSDLLVLSPGVPISIPAVAWARKKKIPVIGEIELAFSFCSCPVIAVTGSNGKTTVTTLIRDILHKAGRNVVACGNIGSPFSKHVLDLKKNDCVVCEVSSFQLETIRHFKPHIAVFLNFSQNHLDRYKNMEEYWQAKKRIFENQTKEDFAVLNFQDSRIRELARHIISQVSFFNNPSGKKEIFFDNPNFLAAMEVARIEGIHPDICRAVFDKFKGLEHRLEWVQDLHGVSFINDSKSTTAEAGRWALERSDQPIILICGGRDKNSDFSALREIVVRRVKKMVVFGEAKKKIEQTFAGIVPVEEADDLHKAVVCAQHAAIPGDRVLLSPMCASFDMFLNFEERGKAFKEIVRQLH